MQGDWDFHMTVLLLKVLEFSMGISEELSLAVA